VFKGLNQSGGSHAVPWEQTGGHADG